ncbi:MAG: hypothetical protein ACREHD_24315, partial [Pirellulales bacterium]
TTGTITWAAAVLAAVFTLVSAEAIAKGGRPAEQGEAAQNRARNRAESRDVTYGRAIIFRAGHLPRLEPPADKKHPAELAHPTHYLDTTLPILIQGAPNELALRRYSSTS